MKKKKGAPIQHGMTVTPSELAAFKSSGDISFCAARRFTSGRSVSRLGGTGDGVTSCYSEMISQLPSGLNCKSGAIFGGGGFVSSPGNAP